MHICGCCCISDSKQTSVPAPSKCIGFARRCLSYCPCCSCFYCCFCFCSCSSSGHANWSQVKCLHCRTLRDADSADSPLGSTPAADEGGGDGGQATRCRQSEQRSGRSALLLLMTPSRPHRAVSRPACCLSRCLCCCKCNFSCGRAGCGAASGGSFDG